jgi:hypothetical protein
MPGWIHLWGRRTHSRRTGVRRRGGARGGGAAGGIPASWGEIPVLTLPVILGEKGGGRKGRGERELFLVFCGVAAPGLRDWEGAWAHSRLHHLVGRLMRRKRRKN